MFAEKEVVDALRKEAQTNRVAKEVFLVFAMRDRARSMVTVGGLEQRMKANGFPNNTKEDYAKILMFLDKLGLGKIMVKSNGKVIGLKDIKVKLQSIGEVAHNKESSLEGFHARNTFQKLEIPKQAPKPLKLNELKSEVSIKVELSPGIRYEIPIPKEATVDQITSLIRRLM